EEGKKTYFSNKKDRIILHLKKCKNFLSATTPEKQVEIFASANNLSTKKRLYNYIVWALSKEDCKQFNKLLLKMTVSCEWSLSWINNPEARECFKFLNLLLVLPDCRTLGDQILNEIVNDANKEIETVLKKNLVGITLTYDEWTNVKNRHLLGTVILLSEGRPYVWKAIDISSERKKHQDVINKTKLMIVELESLGIKVCAIVMNSATKALNMSKLRANITYQHCHELDIPFSAFLHITSTQITNNSNVELFDTEIVDEDNVDEDNDIDQLDEFLNENNNNEETNDNEEYNLPYISEIEFVEILEEEKEADIIGDQDNILKSDDNIYLAIDKNAKWKLA
ncbi:3128_t:CDS:2, partial [Scutellospora calospora]